MPAVREKTYPVFLVVSDLHLWQTPPVARSAEKDWFGVMENYLYQWDQLRKEVSSNSNFLPSVIAGDIFDRYNPSSELVNFVIKHFPRSCYAVPGQHDMINHRYEDIHKTAYWTLVGAKTIEDIPYDHPVELIAGGGMPVFLHGFPWGYPPRPLMQKNTLAMDVAVVHDYLWTSTSGYTDAPEDKRLKNRWSQFEGYDVVVVGDNHVPFTVRRDHHTVYNCGGFMRRRHDERDHRPSIGIVMSDNTVVRHYLDVSKDRFADVGDVAEKTTTKADRKDFVAELMELGDKAMDFSVMVRRYVDKYGTTEDGVLNEIEEALRDEE